MNPWFARFNTRGEVVSGSGEIWFWGRYDSGLKDARQISGGWTPAFLDNSWVVFNNGNTVSTFDLVNNRTTVRKEVADYIVAAQGNYIMQLIGVITYQGRTYDGTHSRISKSGRNVIWTGPYQSEARKLYINTQEMPAYMAPIAQCDISDLAVVWTEFEGGGRRVFGYINSQPVEELTVRAWEESYLCDVAGVPYIISTFQDGIGAREFGKKEGYFRPGTFYIGDSLYIDGKLIVVGNDEATPLFWDVLTENDGLVDFTTLDSGGESGGGGGGDMNYDDEINKLKQENNQQQNEINELYDRVAKLESSKPSSGSGIKSGSLVSLKSSRGKYMRDDWDSNNAKFDRDEAGEGEKYIITGDENSGPFPPNPETGRLEARDKFFYQNGELIRMYGFTAFPLIDRFAKGEDIDAIVSEYAHFNFARVFLYTPRKDWGDTAWDMPSKYAVENCLHYCAEHFGLNLKLVLCTDDDSSQIDRINEIVEHLRVNRVDNLIFEAVNEPYIHNKLDPNTFKNILSNSGYLYSSGVYTDNRKFYGKYWTDHSSRDSEWWRKGGHNLLEAWNGGGPNFPDEPALRMPGVQGEPIKPNEAGYAALDFYAYAASCGLMGAGAVFHSESGKFCHPLNAEEENCKDAFLKGLWVYPLDAANGQYRRIVEDGQNDSARTYVMGNYAIRIHQNGLEFPETGWNPLDDFGICWERA